MVSTSDDLVLPRRLQRLADEIDDEAPRALDGAPDGVGALVELAYALRPHKHEGRVPTYGALLIDDVAALNAEKLNVKLIDVAELDRQFTRRFADGVSSFAVRSEDGISHIACFARNIADEHDLVDLQSEIGGVIVQRHPRGQVRVFSRSGVVRWDMTHWRHDSPVDAWVHRLNAINTSPTNVLRPMLRFAIHDLAGRGIGATLIWRPDDVAIPAGRQEHLVHNAPQLSLHHFGEEAALAQALAQTDGAAVFDSQARLINLGIRLVPSSEAEAAVGTIGGMRHISALRYSYDDPDAIIIVVSEAGPVTIMHNGQSITTIDRSEERIG